MNEQDQRKNSDMDDSTSMTIEFLRARLLSERSVSRTARQRADELATRVADLEEQLKFVSLQRRKAEKATADVLAILENHGISDVSEASDSDSDQEGTPRESKVGYGFSKEEEISISSKARSDGNISGSDCESSSIHGRSLSWKSSKGLSHSLEKKNMNSPSRRRSSFMSVGSSSSRNRQGKSCRQIRRRETRLAVDDSKGENAELHPQPNIVVASSESLATVMESGTKHLRDGCENEEAKVNVRDTISLTNASHYPQEHEGDRDMEKALEHQAELIGRYEAEEKAQREWEEKFREINSSTPDSCEPGNQSDVTEERYEIKAPATYSVGTDVSLDKDTKSEAKDQFKDEFSRVHYSGSQPSSPIDVQDERSNGNIANESPAPEFAFSLDKGKQVQENTEWYSQFQASHNFHYHPRPHESHPNGSAQILSQSHESSLTYRDENSGNQKEKYALVPHQPPKEVGGVLEALQQAKLSLQFKLSKSSFPEGGPLGNANETYFPAKKPGNMFEMPVGSARLFRLPTDFQTKAAPPSNIGSSSRLSLANYYPDSGSAVAVGNQFTTLSLTDHFSDFGPVSTVNNQFNTPPYSDIRSGASGSDRFATRSYMGSRLGVSSNDRFLNNPYSEMVPIIPMQRPYSDQYLDTSLSSSSRYTYPAYTSFPDPMQRAPVTEGFSGNPSNRTGKISPDTFSFHGDNVKPNVYRY